MQDRRPHVVALTQEQQVTVEMRPKAVRMVSDLSNKMAR